DRDVRQRARRVAFDEIQADEADRPHAVRTDVEPRQHAAVGERGELVQRVDAGAAGLDERGHALVDADAVGVGEAERAVDVDVDVDPARAQVRPGDVYDFSFFKCLSYGVDLAVCNGDVDHPVDALRPVDNVRASKNLHV